LRSCIDGEAEFDGDEDKNVDNVAMGSVDVRKGARPVTGWDMGVDLLADRCDEEKDI
jgi:hypothetical protein